MTHKLVLLRHGQSQWNLENRFTGWKDVDLTDLGRKEAATAGHVMKEEGLEFDLVFTSVLTRAIRTMQIAMGEMGQLWVPVIRDWRLNERSYGGLQGMNKAETAEKHGAEQVKIWRRSYSTPPPALTEDDERHPKHDRRYADVDPALLPLTESLKETVERFVPYYESTIKPEIQAGKTLLIAAHGNSLRALVKYLDNMSEEEILELNIPTGIPLMYELDDNLKPISKRYLGDEEAAKAAAEAVANQAKAK